MNKSAKLLHQYLELLHQYGYDADVHEVRDFARRHRDDPVFTRRVKTLNCLALLHRAFAVGGGDDSGQAAHTDEGEKGDRKGTYAEAQRSPLNQYQELLQLHGDPNAPEVLTFLEKHVGDIEFAERAAKLSLLQTLMDRRDRGDFPGTQTR